MFFEQLCKELSSLKEVEALALGGSRATNSHDEKSDYDLYVYITAAIDEKIRRVILERYCKYLEIGNAFWELEDDCLLNDDIPIDIIYRDLADFAKGLKRTVIDEEASNAYTTCFYHNLQNAKIIYDEKGRLAALKKRYDIPYPEGLRRNIIKRGLDLLSGKLPSYDLQLIKAVSRKDFFSINHRTTAFLETYFDVIFAINRVSNPGEKRILEKTKATCKLLPKDYERNVMRLLNRQYENEEGVTILLREMVDNLKGIID